jgi:hypothetical protein
LIRIPATQRPPTGSTRSLRPLCSGLVFARRWRRGRAPGRSLLDGGQRRRSIGGKLKESFEFAGTKHLEDGRVNVAENEPAVILARQAV